MKNLKAESGKKKPEPRIYVVWVIHPLRYVQATSPEEARRRYRMIFEKYPKDLAVIEHKHAKRHGLCCGLGDD